VKDRRLIAGYLMEIVGIALLLSAFMVMPTYGLEGPYAATLVLGVAAIACWLLGRFVRLGAH
jgi:hypothetical protein